MSNISNINEIYIENTKINQIYIEILCNYIKKQNIKLLENIGNKEMIPIKELLERYIISKTDIKNILTINNN